jgi:hypothetical protein
LQVGVLPVPQQGWSGPPQAAHLLPAGLRTQPIPVSQAMPERQQTWSAFPQGEQVPPTPAVSPTQARPAWQFAPGQQAAPLAPQVVVHMPAALTSGGSEQASPA